MTRTSIVYLMYHELELAGRKFSQSDPGCMRYVLPIEAFRQQMKWMKCSGFRGLSVGEALKSPAGPAVCITFDDGCETDLIAAAPVLIESDFHATFYVAAGFLGKRGYMTLEQLQELSALGFEIGCHSMTHPYFSDLAEAELKREIVDAKQRIEQIVGHGIQHLSCPGGRYDRRTLDVATWAGFMTVANSEVRANSSATNRQRLGRVAVLRGLSLDGFAAICRGEGLWKKRLQQRMRGTVQRALGNNAYDKLRAALLG